MLYYITEEIVRAAEKGDTRVTDILEYIAIAHSQGRHFVISSRELLVRLSKIDKYSNAKIPSIYKYILSKYATYGNITSIIRLKVIFVLKETPYVLKDENGRYTEIGCPINNATFDLLINETGLLFENIKESEFYHYINEYYKKKKTLKINNRYHALNGGGDTTKDVLQEISNSKRRFCISFLDSDKKHPEASLGDTLNGVIKARKKNQCYYTSDYIYTDKYREIENMIPLDILEITSKDDVNWLNGVKDINAITRNEKDVYYYDIKNGINKEKYANLKNSKEIQYIRKHIILARNISSEEFDKMISMDDLPNKLLFGVGNKVLQRAVNHYKQHFTEWVEDAVLPIRLENEWIKMGEEITAWTCASFPIRV